MRAITCICDSAARALPARRRSRNIPRCLPIICVTTAALSRRWSKSNRPPAERPACRRTRCSRANWPSKFSSPAGRPIGRCTSRPPVAEFRSDAAAGTDAAAADTRTDTTSNNDGTEVSLDDLCNALIHLGAGQRSADPVLRQSALAGERAARRCRQQERRHGHRAIHAGGRRRKRSRRSVRSDAGDPGLGAVPARACACNSAISALSPRPTMPARTASPIGSKRRGSLPHETRDYVLRVTGLSVDAWRNMPRGQMTR